MKKDHPDIYDKSGNFLVTPVERGRVAFWNGRAIWANPFIQLQAQEWREGWLKGQAELAALGGTSDEDRARLRPIDLPKPRPKTWVTRRGVGTRSRHAQRARGSIWRMRGI